MNELFVGPWSTGRCQASYFFIGEAGLRVTSLFWCLAWLGFLPNGLKDILVCPPLLEHGLLQGFLPAGLRPGSLVHALMTCSSKEAKQT